MGVPGFFKTLLLFIAIFAAIYTQAQPRTLPIPSGDPVIDSLSKKALDLVVDNKAVNYTQALMLADSIRHIAVLNESYRAECTAYGNLATIFKLNRNFDLAAQYAQKAIDVAQRGGDKNFSLPQAYRLMGSVHMGQLNWEEALEYYFKALKIYEQADDVVQQSLIVSEIGTIYHRSKDVEKAKKYYTEALNLLGTRDRVWEIYFRNRLSTALLATGQYDESIQEAQKAVSLLKSMKDPWMLPLVTHNIAGAYFKKGDLNKAEAISRNVIEMAKKNSESIGGYLIGLAEILEAEGKTAEAEKTYIDGIEDAVKRSDIYSELDGREAITHFYEQTGQQDKAYKATLKLADVKDSVFGKDKAIAIQELEYKYENEKKEAQITTLEAKSRLKTWLIIASMFAALLALMFLWNYRKNAMLSRALMLQKQKTLEQERENALIEKELEKEQKQKAQLNQKLKEEENRRLQIDIAATNRELAAITLYVQEKNKLLEDLQEQLSNTISKSIGQEKTDLQNINRTIRQSISFEHDWDKIKLHFEKVHPGFFQKLQHQYPALTQNELKHCAYIRMNMNNKETANLMNVDSNSVKVSRYRIKKKLNLTPEEDLNVFMSNI